MPVETVHLYILVSAVGLAMAILFPILASIRDAYRRENTHREKAHREQAAQRK